MELNSFINADLDKDCHCRIPVYKEGADMCEDCTVAQCGSDPDSDIFCELIVKQKLHKPRR